LTIDGGACHRPAFPAICQRNASAGGRDAVGFARGSISRLAPRLGEQSHEILGEAGFMADETAKLVTDGVARAAPSISQQQG
jgi:hypothetical protein